MSKKVIKLVVYKKQKGKCFYCGVQLKKTEATLDHYIPKSLGGSNGKMNLKLCCFGCNQKKASMLPWEFINDAPYHKVIIRKG